MAKQGIWNTLGLISRLILGGAFIYASLDKIAHPGQFAEIIYNYKILPTELVNLAAMILPWTEMLAGVFLLAGRLTLPSAFILTSLVLVFIAAISFNLARGLDFQCGCFTTSPEATHTGLMTLYRDLLLMIPAVICLKTYWDRLPKAETA